MIVVGPKHGIAVLSPAKHSAVSVITIALVLISLTLKVLNSEHSLRNGVGGSLTVSVA